MNITNETFKLQSDKIKSDYTFCLLADIHSTKTSSMKLWNELINQIDKMNPNYIFVAGDIGYTADDYFDSEVSKKTRYLFSSLQDIAPVFVSIGNHELKSGRKYTSDESLTEIKSIERDTKITILDSRFDYEMFDLGDIRIGGFCPRVETYYRKYGSNWSRYFIDDYIKTCLEYTTNQYNILLTHSPDTISKIKVLKELRERLVNLDLILCGHKHDGFIPKCIQKACGISEDKGLAISDGYKMRDY